MGSSMFKNFTMACPVLQHHKVGPICRKRRNGMKFMQKASNEFVAQMGRRILFPNKTMAQHYMFVIKVVEVHWHKGFAKATLCNNI